jgi:hypothetical protein
MQKPNVPIDSGSDSGSDSTIAKMKEHLQNIESRLRKVEGKTALQLDTNSNAFVFVIIGSLAVAAGVFIFMWLQMQ